MSDSDLFVSRESEIKTLQDHYSWVIKNKSPRMVFIGGDFGVGKKTLVEHFIASTQKRNKSLLVGKGKCSLEDKDNGRIPFAQVFGNLLQDQNNAEKDTKKILKFVYKTAPAWIDYFTLGFLEALTTTIDEFIVLIKSENPVNTVFETEQIFTQFTNAVSEISKDKPVIIFINDLQWADESSLRLLFHLLNNLVDRSVLVIGTYRQYDSSQSQNRKLFSEIHSALILKKLAYELHLEEGLDIFEYVRKRYGVHSFSSKLLKEITDKSDGLAIYVTELFNLWEQQGLVLRVKKNNLVLWSIDPSAKPEIPDGIKNVLKERMKFLENNFKNIVTTASVEGEDFSAQTISSLLEIDKLIIYDDLRILEAEYNLIKEEGAGKVGDQFIDLYIFVHRFIRDYVYSHEISRGKKRELHSRIGKYIEQVVGNPKPVASKLARHFKEAGEERKALNYIYLAAEYEKERFSWAECQNWCEQGLALLDKIDSNNKAARIDFLELLADCKHFTSDYKKALQIIAKSLEIGQDVKLDPKRLINLCGYAIETCELMNQFAKAEFFIIKGNEIIKKYNFQVCESFVYFKLGEGLIYIRQGKIKEGIEILDACVINAKKLSRADSSLIELLGNAYNELGVAYSVIGKHHKSCPLFQRAAEIVKSTGNLYLEALYLGNLIGDLFWVVEDATLLTKPLEDAQLIARQIGDLDTQAFLYSVKGNILLEQGKYVDASAALNDAINLWKQLDELELSSGAYSDLARAELSLGKTKEAQISGKNALTYSTRGTEKGCALDVLGMIEFVSGNQTKSFKYFRSAISILQKDKAEHFAVIAQRHCAEAQLKCGQKEEGKKLLKEALETARTLRIPREIRNINKSLSSAG